MIIIIMGVSGSGKSTVGKLLGEKLGWRFYEGDNYHTKSNIQKMQSGIPLDDEDRKPWLLNLRSIIEKSLSANENIILSCSALKESYRKILQINDEVKFVYLKGSLDTIKRRMNQRQNHFMKTNLLQSQFDALEEPALSLVVDVNNPPEEIIEIILKKINS